MSRCVCTTDEKQPQILRLGRPTWRTTFAQDDSSLRVIEPVGKLLRVVDLRALQLVRVVDVDGFPSGEEVEGAEAFSVAVAGALDAAEGEMDFGAYGGCVDVGDACFEVAHGGEGAIDVARVERSRESVVDGVGDGDGFVKIGKLENRDDGAEDFFASDAHLRRDAGEDGWREEGSVGIGAFRKSDAAQEHLSAFALCDVDVASGRFNLLPIDLRADFDGFVEAVADFELAGAGDEPFSELGGDALLKKDAAGCGATLAGGSKCAPERAVEGEVEVGVVEDDLRVLATHLKRDLLEGGGGALGDERTDFTGTGEADGADAGVFDERRAGLRAEAGHDVDNAGRQAGFDERLDEVIGGERRVLGRLDDAGVAGDERGKELPTGDGHGEVPRRDEADHADGHADGHGELVWQLAGGGDAEEAAAFSGDVEGFVDGFLDVAAGFGEDLAHFVRHLARVFLFVLDKDVAGTHENLRTLGRGDETPGGEGFFRGGDGAVDVFCSGGRKLADDVGVVGGVEVKDGLAAGGRQPLAADEVVVGGVGHSSSQFSVSVASCRPTVRL